MRFRSFFPAMIAVVFVFSQSCNESSPKKRPPTPREKFTDNIRTTAFRTPAEEQQGFKLPKGFEMTLYASEPDIGKPINMAFDDRGRLWVTQSSEYPLPATMSHGNDKITILEDTDGDGKADKFTHFEDTLNIPIGIMPMADGAVAYSIPAIHYYTDTNNDGKADRQKTLFNGFGHKDTHGMVSNFIRGFDGWINSCHGFSNTSRIAGTDGDSVIMTSGNTFRFRPDGSHVELTSHGRVNPFGFTYDEKGYLYSVDCHSKPIYQIISGGEYPGFGKRVPGIGYAPEMMSYELGSTALCGLNYYIGEQFPPEYRNCFYSGDVVTCQINRNTITYKGSTPVSKREADFVVSDDPWFRPVAITMGPDGALYVADFYNRIIGHYEVPLDHPGRDRQSGRIWKITYHGDDAKKAPAPKDWTKASLDELIQGLQNPQLELRMRIANRLTDVWKEKAIAPLTALLTTGNQPENTYVEALWILFRLNALPDAILNKALVEKNDIVRVHALRILAEKDKITTEQKSLALQALSAENAHVRRAACVVLGKFRSFDNTKALLNLYMHTDTADTHLLYTALLSIRDNLKEKEIINKVIASKWDSTQLQLLTKAMQDAPSAEGATFLMNYISSHNLPQEQMVSCLEYIGRYLPKSKLDHVIKFVRQKFANDVESQFILYSTMRQGVAQSGSKPSEEMKQWGIVMAQHTLNGITETSDPWSSHPLDPNAEYNDPWVSRDNFFYPMVPKFRVIYSEKFGYVPTGILKSRPFKLPPQLTMNIFDYSIHNTDARTGISQSSVRIRLKSNDKVIGEYRLNQQKPSKIEDVVKVNYRFDLKEWAGQEGYIEAVDSSQIGSFGVGNLQPQVVPVPELVEADLVDRRLKAIGIADEYKASSMIPALKNLAGAKWMNDKIRMSAADALIDIDPKKSVEFISNIFIDKSTSLPLRKGLVPALGQAPSPKVYETLVQGLAGGDHSLQTAIARIMAASPAGIDRLFVAVKQGIIQRPVLEEVSVKESLETNATASQRKEVDQLIGNNTDVRKDRDKIIQERLASFKASTATPQEGRNVFLQNCSMCHSIKGSGGMIAPQLDGIGNWGAQALAQKVLDPNRNISPAFRMYNIKLKNGKQLTGLYRRTEGEVMIYADFTGKEFSVAKADVKENIPSKYTLMPDQFRNTISEKNFDALLKYLTSVK